MQADGNLVLYRSRHFVAANAIWASGTNGKGTAPYKLSLQTDGNLVIYDSTNKTTWASNTTDVGIGPHSLIMQEDRNCVLYDSTGRATWATNTSVVPVLLEDTLGNDVTLNQTQFIASQNGYAYLVMQADGNLVLYRSRDFVSSTAVWASGTNGKGSAPFRLTMQSDGNLVIYDSTNKPTWASGTNGKGVGPYRLVMHNDRHCVIYDGTNRAEWAIQPTTIDPTVPPSTVPGAG